MDSLKFVERWILDRVARATVDVALLLRSGKSLRDQWQCNSYGITPPRVLTAIEHLSYCGDISGHSSSDLSQPALAISSLRSELHRLTADTRGALWLRITPAGGLRWEDLNNIAWEDFIEINESASGQPDATDLTGTRIATAGSWNRLKRLIRSYPTECGRLPDLAHARLEIIEHWKAVYWKDLPRGYRTQFPFRNIMVVDDQDIVRCEADVDRFLAENEELVGT